MQKVTFTMLVGPPGSGKSTWVENNRANFSANTEVISSDSYREKMGLPPHGKENHAKVFEEMKLTAWTCLTSGNDVIYDATNLSGKRRKQLITELKAYVAREGNYVDVKYEYILFSETIETLIERDAKRERTVGKEVIINLLKSYTQPSTKEGFDFGRVVHGTAKAGYGYYMGRMQDFEQDNKWHTGTLLEHVTEALSCLLSKMNTLSIEDIHNLSEAVRWHDVGKLYTKSFFNRKGEPVESATYYNHSNISSYLRNQSDVSMKVDANLVAFLIENHMVDVATAKKLRKNNSYDYVVALLTLQECDKWRPKWFRLPKGDRK